MGQIISISINNEVKNASCQAVTISEKRRGLPVVKSASYINSKDIAKLAAARDIKVACAYDGIITESVDIPPVNNVKSKIFLLKNKMKDHLKKELEYSFAYFENPGKAEPPNINYTVYASPIYVLKDEIKVGQKSLGSIKSFTFDFFAVAGVSATIDPVGSVFHVYADKDRIIMVLSTGTKVEYYRASNVPPQVTTPESLSSFYYENVNLTYLYVRQNFSNLAMQIILSGKLAGDVALKESFATFIDKPMTNLSAKGVVAGASDKLLNEFLIPIGHVLLRGKLDFSSETQLGDRLFSRIVTVINVAFLIGIIACSAYTYQRFMLYIAAQDRLERSARNFLQQENALVSNIGDGSLLNYRAKYLNLLADRVNTPLLLLAPSQDIMSFYMFDKIEFSGRGESSQVIFLGDKKQDNYASVEDFKEQVQAKVRTAIEKHVKAEEDGSSHTFKDLQNKIVVHVASGGASLVEAQAKAKAEAEAALGDNATAAQGGAMGALTDNATAPQGNAPVPLENIIQFNEEVKGQ